MTHTMPCGCRWPVIGPAPREGALPLLDVDIGHLPDCPLAWDMMSKGITKGVFQLESRLGSQWSKRLKPRNNEHLSALGALLRPGCLMAKDDQGVSMTEHYCRRVNKEEPADSFHPALDEILAPTEHILVYQEQSMMIGAKLAGFDLKNVDRLRKAIGKKDQKEMGEVKKLFLEGAAQQKVVPEEVAKEVWSWIEKSGRYQFNKCAAADTIIRRACRTRYSKGVGFTVEQLYRIKNDRAYAKAHGHFSLHRKMNHEGHYGSGLSLCGDGRIRKNVIREIIPAGRHGVLKITTESGATIRVTVNHKFPTTEGQKLAALLRPGDGLYLCGAYEPTDFRVANRFSDMTNLDRAAIRGRSGKNTHGAGNRWYTNGSFTDFEAACALLPAACETCGEAEKRLEVHHVDGDRTNSHPRNLRRLCVSCHKKADYALGRTRRGQKGYPAVVDRVVSVEADGEADTYDVTMDAPNHNFVVGSGLVTCNSHSMSYGLTGYDTAYLKSHFPVQFYTSWLSFAEDKVKPDQEVMELVEDARRQGVLVLPPDVRQQEMIFHTDGVDIYFGLGNIKGLGEASLVKMLARIKEVEGLLGKPLSQWCWFDWLLHVGSESVSVSQRLVMAGALDWVGLKRQRMLAELEVVGSMTDKELEYLRGQVVDGSHATFSSALRFMARTKKEGGGCANAKRASLVRGQADLLDSPPTPLNDNPAWMAWAEEQVFGFPLTCTRVDGCDLGDANTTVGEFLAGKTGFLLLGVEIRSVRIIKTKKGTEMAFLSLADSSGVLDDVTCFSEALEEYRHLLTQGNTVLVQGGRDKKRKSLLINKVFQLT